VRKRIQQSVTGLRGSGALFHISNCGLVRSPPRDWRARATALTRAHRRSRPAVVVSGAVPGSSRCRASYGKRAMPVAKCRSDAASSYPVPWRLGPIRCRRLRSRRPTEEGINVIEALIDAKHAIEATIARECSGGDTNIRCDIVELIMGAFTISTVTAAIRTCASYSRPKRPSHSSAATPTISA
jgi:hypothetical protein